VASLLQLVPMSQHALERYSSPTHAFLMKYNVEYATNALVGSARHPLSIEPSRTWMALAFLGALGAFAVGTGCMLTRTAARGLAQHLSALGVFMSAVALVQRAIGNGKIYGLWQPLMGGEPYGPFVNRNHFAGWILMGLPVTIGLLAAQLHHVIGQPRPGLRNRLLWLGSPGAMDAVLLALATATMAVALTMTYSRSGICGLILAMALGAWTVLRRPLAPVRRAVVVGWVLLLPLLACAWAGFDLIAGRFGGDTLSVGRGAIWRGVLPIAKDFFATGTGLNTFGIATLVYPTSLTGAHLREAHNDYLQLAVEGGLLVGLPIVVTIAGFAWEIRRRFRLDAPTRTSYWLRAGAVTGMLAIAFQSIVEFSLQMPGNAVMFAVLAGIALHNPGGLAESARTHS
jgi:O-antigen ligase